MPTTTLFEVYSTPGGVPTWTAVDVPQTVDLVKLVAHGKGVIPSLLYSVRGGPLPGLPDPWDGKTVRLTINGTLYFFGDTVRADPEMQDRLGWFQPYTALGLRNRGDWVPHTDSNNGIDSSSYNLSADNQGPDYLPSRAGRTVGEILIDVLSNQPNSAALISVGIGNYSSAGFGAAATVTAMSGTAVGTVAPAAGGGGLNYSVAPLVVTVGGNPTTLAVITATVSGGVVTGYTVVSGGTYASTPAILVTTLPSATIADLTAMVFQPPGPVYVSGEKLLGAVEGFLSSWCPNFILNVEPGGNLRFWDTRTYTNHTFTFETDRVIPSGISRDLSECFQRVLVRGAGIAEMARFSTKVGNLFETPFVHDGLTIAQAKAAWIPDDYFRPELVGGRVEGTCTCPDTLHVTITPDISSTAFAANAYDQTLTGRHGMLSLIYSAATDVTMIAQRLVVANTVLVASGTSTLTLDRAIPHLLYDHFTMTGLTQGASAVWTDYALPAWAGPKVAQQSQYPMNLKYANGNAETQVSTATGIIRWSSSGSPPYQEGISGISVDNGSGIVRFNYPTRLTAGKQPDDVEVWIPIYTDVNQAIWPADTVVMGVSTPNYAGTSNTVDGLTKTLTVTIPGWRDPANNAAMLLYAADLLDSVSKTVSEGVISFMGLYEPALTPGTSYSVTGSSYLTGWEGLDLANVQTELAWNVDGLNFVTSIRVSSRRAHFSAEAFAHPSRTGVTFDWREDASIDLSQQGVAEATASQQQWAAQNLQTAGTELPGAAPTTSPSGVMDSAAGYHQAGVDSSVAAAQSLPNSMADLGISLDTGAATRDAVAGLQSFGVDLSGGGSGNAAPQNGGAAQAQMAQDAPGVAQGGAAQAQNAQDFGGGNP